MFYDVVFFKPKEVTVRLLPDGTYNVIKPAGYTIQALNARPPIDQSAEVAALKAKVAQLEADIATCLAGGPPAPMITNFVATPPSLPIGGGPVTLDWATTDATSVKLDGNPAVPPVVVQVTSSHVFSMVATGVTAPPAMAQISVDVALPAIDPTLGAVTTRVVSLIRALIVPGFSDGGRYKREQPLIVLPNTPGLTTVMGSPENPTVAVQDGVAKISIGAVNIAAGGVAVPFGSALALTLTFDGVAVAAATTLATANAAIFTVDLAPIAEGHYMVGVNGAPGWDVLEYPMYVAKGPTAAPQAAMHVVIGSYSLINPFPGTPTVYHRARVPAAFAPVEQPLSARVFPSFTSVGGWNDLVKEQIAICRQGDVYRSSVNGAGVWTTANHQNYFGGHLSEKLPQWPLLDGPRGRGTVTCPTSLRPGRNYKEYFTDPWRFAVVEVDGRVRTLAGPYHEQPPAYYGSTQNLVLVGDWSAIPVARHGFNELWDFVWDPDTLTTDPNAPPIGGEPPHVTGPVAYLMDTLNGRVCKVEFSPTDRAAPAKVTEAIVGLNNPWGCEIVGGLLYVSERFAHKVLVYDKATLTLVRTYSITQPEGVRYQDGFLYVGSKPSECVWKINLSTHAITKHCTVPVDLNSGFVNLAISDGTFYARGTIATVTWSVNGNSYPHMFDPTGAIFNWLANGNQAPAVGPPGPRHVAGEPSFGYPTAVSIGAGRMTFGTVQEGLTRFSRATPTDKPLSPLYGEGYKQWISRGYHITHGHHAFGFYGLPQPWGVTPEIDAVLTDNGHTRP